jgi:hypothetical protein
MKNFKKINIDQIVSIKTFIGYESTDYEYKEKPKHFAFLFPKEGFYFKYSFSSEKYRSKEQIEKSGAMFCKDKKVMYYPHIEMRMSNQSLSTKYFKTEEDLKEYYDTHLASLNLIDL